VGAAAVRGIFSGKAVHRPGDRRADNAADAAAFSRGRDRIAAESSSDSGGDERHAGNTGPITLEETEGNLASMAELAHANGIRTVLSSVMPVSNYGHDRNGNALDMRIKRPPEKILELNAWIKKYAAERDHVYLDYFSAMVDEHGLLKKELSEDGLHPNSAGYAVMAPLAEKAIEAALSAKASKN
jgi:lysophospholipase L1-like esterase